MSHTTLMAVSEGRLEARQAANQPGLWDYMQTTLYFGKETLGTDSA